MTGSTWSRPLLLVFLACFFIISAFYTVAFYCLFSLRCVPQSEQRTRPTRQGTASAEAQAAQSSYGSGAHGWILLSLNWSISDLHNVGLWHATAQYQSIIKLIAVGRRPLAIVLHCPYLTSYLKAMINEGTLDVGAKKSIRSFLRRHVPPPSVTSMFRKQDRAKVSSFANKNECEHGKGCIQIKNLAYFSAGFCNKHADFISKLLRSA